MCAANATCVMLSGLRNSSSRISPGWVGVRLVGIMSNLVVVVENSNIKGVASNPSEHQSPLVVDADRPMTTKVALQLLEAVPRRNSEVDELIRGVEEIKLSQRGVDQIRRKSRGTRAGVVEPLSVAVAEGGDHMLGIRVARQSGNF